MANKTQERTLFILKPDALQRGLLGEILHRFERKGLKIVGTKLSKLPEESLDQHYAEHKGKPFLPSLKKFMSSGPVLLVVFEGLEAVKVVRALCGKTDGKEAELGSIRGDFGLSRSNNLVHSSSDLEAAQREIAIWFKPAELLDYESAHSSWSYSEEEKN